MSDDEQRWCGEKERNGWELPMMASWWWRLPVVRRVRGTWLAVQVMRHNRAWRAMGMVPTGYDEWVIYAVHRGWC